MAVFSPALCFWQFGVSQTTRNSVVVGRHQGIHHVASKQRLPLVQHQNPLAATALQKATVLYYGSSLGVLARQRTIVLWQAQKSLAADRNHSSGGLKHVRIRPGGLTGRQRTW